ncbi:MAG: AAA family ATPase [Gemmataceae bacterium]|nr:AAA family ATPase [Gemmataceae bacterium]
MELADLIAALSQPVAYPYPVERVEVVQTHISAVFLAGDFVYKVKKPVTLGFLDFGTLDRRRHFCDEEVRLNRRLAASVYVGVVPIARYGSGLRVEGDGEAVEWAVKMHRLPVAATLRDQLQRGDADAPRLRALAQTVARFHVQANRGEAISAFGRFDVVLRNARENFTESTAQIDDTISQTVFERLRVLTEQSLARLKPLIDVRAERDVPCDTHGDLRLEHVYLFPDRTAPDDLVIIDCVEFAERFRYADPVADVAFLVMELIFNGWEDLATVFADAYFQAAGDAEGRTLLPFYTAYRSAVRGKVQGMKAVGPEVPDAERARAQARSRAHWLLALGELEAPARRPCLVLTGGLPGTGKSTLARGLAEHASFEVIRSDVVRKELAGVVGSTPGPFREGLYSAEQTKQTYAECLRRAKELLFEGRRVLVDANFGEDQHRRAFLETAREWGVPGILFICEAEPPVVKRRLELRRGDASDADWAIYQEKARQWEAASAETHACAIGANGSPGEALVQALDRLRDVGLV